jgi:hypothetical protein
MKKKSKNPVILNVIHYCQNPLEYTFHEICTCEVIERRRNQNDIHEEGFAFKKGKAM